MACATLKRSCEWDPLQSPGGSTPKRQRCGSAIRSPVAKYPKPQEKSPFATESPKLTSEQIADNIRKEIHKLHHKRQLCFDLDRGSSPGSPSSISSPHGSPSSSPLPQEKPLFTYQQLCLYCERMIKERESKIRDEYDTILNVKLAEQYDTYLKFSYDQMQRRAENSTPSYLS